MNPIRVILEELLLSFSFGCDDEKDSETCEDINNKQKDTHYFELRADKELFDLIYHIYSKKKNEKPKIANDNINNINNISDILNTCPLAESIPLNNTESENSENNYNGPLDNKESSFYQSIANSYDNEKSISDNKSHKSIDENKSMFSNNNSEKRENQKNATNTSSNDKNEKHNKLIEKLKSLSTNPHTTFLSIFEEIKQNSESVFRLILESKIKYKTLTAIWDSEKYDIKSKKSKRGYSSLNEKDKELSLFLFLQEKNKNRQPLNNILNNYTYKQDFIDFIYNKKETVLENNNKDYLKIIYSYLDNKKKYF